MSSIFNLAETDLKSSAQAFKTASQETYRSGDYANFRETYTRAAADQSHLPNLEIVDQANPQKISRPGEATFQIRLQP